MEQNILKYYLIALFSHCYPSHALKYSTLKTGASVWNGGHTEDSRKRKGQVIGLWIPKRLLNLEQRWESGTEFPPRNLRGRKAGESFQMEDQSDVCNPGGLLEDNCPCVCSIVLVASDLCDPMDYGLPVSSFHGILQAGMLEWVAMPSSRGPPWPRNQAPTSSVSCISQH